MLRVGLTGGVGSGKSTVAQMLSELGAEVIDADALAREAVAPGTPALGRIVDAFGAEVLDGGGRLDRAALAAVVFADDAARARLNGIVHPEVARLAAERMRRLEERGARWVVYDVPLLYENGLEEMFDVVVVVDSAPEQRKQRLEERNGWTAAEAAQRMAAQLPLSDKVDRADHVIDNSGSRTETAARVRRLAEILLEGDAS